MASSASPPRLVPKSSISRWNVAGVGFQKVLLEADTGLEFRKIFYDELVLLAFTGAAWKSEQAGQSYVETPDCIVVRDAGQVFSTRLERLEPARGMCCREIHVSPARLAELTRASDRTLPPFELKTPVLRSPALARRLFHVHALFEQPSCELEASTELAQLLAEIARVSSGREVVERTAPCRHRFRLVVDYLRARFDEKISLEELAALTQTNPFVLLRQFRRQLGVTPHEYLRAYRIYRAKEYIQLGMPLAQVAAACGFADQSHFNRQFKRSLSISPRMYRATVHSLGHD